MMEAKKLKKVDVKDFIKENSTGPRLQSLRLPRDLSLGGSKLPKKIYKPNLNVIRNKEKAKEVLRKDKGARENRLQSQNVQKPRFVQSTGVFSEGIGDANRIPEKRVYIKDVEKLEKPQLNINKNSFVPKRTEKEIPNYLIKYDETSEDDDSKESTSVFAPINWDNRDMLKESVKSEFTELLHTFQNHSVNQGISNFNPTVTLWQLPDSLGLKNKTDKKLLDCKLTNLPEGKIGKLCVRRSGKVDVYIGNIKYELEPAEFESYTEDILSLDVKDTEEPVVAVLNKIENRFILNPSWESLLR